MTQGQRIKEIRTALGLSQEEFGAVFNIPKQMVSSLEKDKLKLNNEKLVKLLHDFNININYLLSGIGGMFLNHSLSVGGKIAEIQQRSSLSVSKTAELLNISETEFFDIINGRTQPGIQVLKNLKTHFNTSIDWLLEG